MPQHDSAIKRVRQNKRRAARNQARESRLRTLEKKVRAATTKATASTALREAVKYLDKMAAKGLIHRNTAANHKAKLTKYVNKMTA